MKLSTNYPQKLKNMWISTKGNITFKDEKKI